MTLNLPRLFLFAALVMFVFLLIAAANTALTFLGVAWVVWLGAGLVAFTTSFLIEGVASMNVGAKATG